MYLNRALIIGNLTADPENKSLPSGISVTSFSVATNRVYKDKDGNRKESTDYHNIVVFGRQAETSAQYLKKGQNVLVEGRLQTRSWDGQDGVKRYRTEIIADRVQFGQKSGGQGSGGYSSDNSSNQDSQGSGDSNSGDSGSQIEYPEDEINPEDIPF